MAEGARCVSDGLVDRPSDIDALAVHGLGFPRRLGGPMRAAQSVGLLSLRRDMDLWSGDHDLWLAPELLLEAVKVAGGFDAVRPRA